MLSPIKEILSDKKYIDTLRKKDEQLRSHEENQWISLDCRLFPELYAPNYIPNPQYDLGLCKEAIKKICHMSKKLHHVIGFLEDDIELKAHELINKYYTGVNEVSFCFDGSFTLKGFGLNRDKIQHEVNTKKIGEDCEPEVICLSSIGRNLPSYEDMCKQISVAEGEQALSFLSPKSGLNKKIKKLSLTTNTFFRSIDELPHVVFKKEAVLPHNVYIVVNEDIRIFQTSPLTIIKEEQCVHRFFINSDDPNKYLASISICIISQGMVDRYAYISGRVSATLSYNASDVDNKVEDIGHAPYSLQSINSTKSLGRIIINHETGAPIRSGFFEVILHAHSTTQYSITATGKMSYISYAVIRDEICNFLLNRIRIQERLNTHACNAQLDIRIAKRKELLLDTLISKAEGKQKECQWNLDEYESMIENEDIAGHDVIDEYERMIENENLIGHDAIFSKRKDLELKHAHVCCLLHVRSKTREDNLELIQNLTRSKIKHNTIANDLMLSNKKRKHDLTVAIDLLFGSSQKTELLQRLVEIDHRKYEMLGQLSHGSLDQRLMQKTGSTTTVENSYPDRCRTLLKEFDKVVGHLKDVVPSSILHTLPQLFPKDALKAEIQIEIDKVISDNISSEELSHPLLKQSTNLEPDEDDISSDGTLDYYLEDRCQTPLQDKEDLTTDYIEDSMRRGKSPRQFSLGGKGNKQLHRELNRNNRNGSEYFVSSPDNRYNAIDAEGLEKRRETLVKEILVVRKRPVEMILTSTVVRSESSDLVMFRKNDLLRELSDEVSDIDNRLRMYKVHDELNKVYNEKQEFVTTRALHGYDSLMRTKEAISALEEEQKRLVAVVASKEVLEDILNRMFVEGYFGEAKPPECLASTMKKINMIQYNKPTLIDRALLITDNAQQRIRKEIHFKQKKPSMHALNRTEKSIRMGLFYITFMYFRAMNALRKGKVSCSGDNDLIGGRKIRDMTDERRRMIKEEESARLHQKLLFEVEERAKVGQGRQQRRREHESIARTNRLTSKKKKKALQSLSSLIIQRFYRGNLGRKVAKLWRRKFDHTLALNSLRNSSAVAISRVFRGHVARKRALALKKDIIQYILRIRTEELQRDEDEYWEEHKFKRWKEERGKKL